MAAITAAPTSRPSRWPWIVLGVTAAFAAVGLVFVSLNGYSLLGDATNFIAFMGMGIVGALSLSRAPDNRIGWLLLWVAITVGAAFTTGEASIYAAAHGEHALAAWLAWPGNALWTLGLFPLLILLPLVFPDGRLAVASLALARLGGCRHLVPRVRHDRFRHSHVRRR